MEHKGIYRNYIKRLLDILLSALALIVLSPILLVTALLVRVKLGSPVVFRQARPGMDERIFYLYKFRSMTNEVGEDGRLLPDAQRLTKFGRFLRSSSLDELLELFNILRGDMSIVGPRPHMLKHTEIYSGLIDKYMVRHFSKPGITGWAQVTGFRGETEELWQMEERIKKDIWYIENWSFWLDVKIIGMTALSIIKPDKKAY